MHIEHRKLWQDDDESVEIVEREHKSKTNTKKQTHSNDGELTGNDIDESLSLLQPTLSTSLALSPFALTLSLLLAGSHSPTSVSLSH